jgi:hypothetical protein
LDYGELLNIAYDIFEVQKFGGQILITWKEWLARNVGICDRYARGLREMAKLLEPYPKFRQLGMHFNDLLKNKNEIRILRRTHQESANFWKQG